MCSSDLGSPVVSGLVGVVQRMVAVGESVMGAGLVGGLVEVDRQLQCHLVVFQGVAGVGDGLVDPAQALMGLELPVAVTGLLGASH